MLLGGLHLAFKCWVSHITGIVSLPPLPMPSPLPIPDRLPPAMLERNITLTNLEGKSRYKLCTAHCVHHLPFPGQEQLCEVKLRKWVKKWMWTSLPTSVWFVLLKNLWLNSWWSQIVCIWQLSFCVFWTHRAAWSTASPVAMRIVSLLVYGGGVARAETASPWRWTKGERSSLSHNCLCYPNMMGIRKQTLWLFLCVRVKFMFPTVTLCPSLTLHTKVCKGVQQREVISAT